MLVLLSDVEPNLEARLLDLLPSAGPQVEVLDGWEQLHDIGMEVRCLVVAQEQSAVDELTLRPLQVVRARHPALAIVLVAELGAGHRAVPECVDELVPPNAEEDQIQGAVDAALVQALLRDWDHVLGVALTRTGGFGAELLIPLRVTPPFRSVNEWSRAVGFAPHVLRQELARARDEGLVPVGAGLKRYLRAVLVLRAAELQRQTRSWSAVAERLRVSERTLSRLGREWFDGDLREIGRRSGIDLVEEMRDAVQRL